MSLKKTNLIKYDSKVTSVIFISVLEKLGSIFSSAKGNVLLYLKTEARHYK